jgi:twinkle protein
MNAKELSQKLALQAENLCEALLPNGKRVGSEYKVGGVDGSAGDSMSICLSGSKAGTWCDFADQDQNGDLIDLICAVKNISILEALDFGHQFLGERRPGYPSKKTFKAPSAVPNHLKKIRTEQAKPEAHPVHQFLLNRGITLETADRFRIEAGSIKEDKKDHLAIVMPYIQNGKLVNFKARAIEDKSISRQSAGAKPILYGWHLIKSDCREVTITEGEFDAMILDQCGIPALSVNQGAGNLQWIESDFHLLEQFSTINLWFDNDEAGQAKVEEIMDRLGRDRVKLVLSKEKDANDTFKSGGATAVILELSKAAFKHPEDLVSIYDFTNELEDMFHGTDPRAGLPGLFFGEDINFQITEPEDQPIQFARGELTLVSGYTGMGKTTFLSYQIINLWDHDQNVCVFSGEMTKTLLGKKFVQQFCGSAKPSKTEIRCATFLFDNSLVIFDKLGKVDVREMLKRFEYAAKRFGSTFFIVDSVMMLDAKTKDEDDRETLVMQELVSFARRMNVHVFLVAHPRKPPQGSKAAPAEYDVLGSSNLANMADNYMAVHAYKDADVAQREGCSGYILVTKHRNGVRQHSTTPYHFIEGCQQFVFADGAAGYPKPKNFVNSYSPILKAKIAELEGTKAGEGEIQRFCEGIDLAPGAPAQRAAPVSAPATQASPSSSQNTFAVAKPKAGFSLDAQPMVEATTENIRYENGLAVVTDPATGEQSTREIEIDDFIPF